MNNSLFDRAIKAAATLGGAVIGFFGGWTALLTALVAVMAVDYVSGVFVALNNKSQKTESGGLSSKVGFKGLLKKGMILLVVLVATLVDKVIGSDGMICQSAAICFYIANEGLSVLENAALLGLPVPSAVRRALDDIREKDDENKRDAA